MTNKKETVTFLTKRNSELTRENKRFKKALQAIIKYSAPATKTDRMHLDLIHAICQGIKL